MPFLTVNGSLITLAVVQLYHVMNQLYKLKTVKFTMNQKYTENDEAAFYLSLFQGYNKEKVLFKLFSSNILQKKNIAKKNSSMLQNTLI